MSDGNRGAVTISDPVAIRLYQFKAQIIALGLELKGMKSRGRSMSAVLKDTRGYTGSKAKIHALASADYEKEKAAYLKTKEPAQVMD
jgi:hypothetical protein